MFFYVYILSSTVADRWYVGQTKDLKRRFEEHNTGRSRSTKPYAPWRLIYYEACLNYDDAQRREKYLKTTIGRRMIKKRLKIYLTM